MVVRLECLCLCTLYVGGQYHWCISINFLFLSQEFMLHIQALNVVCKDLMNVLSPNGHVLQQEDPLQNVEER